MQIYLFIHYVCSLTFNIKIRLMREVIDFDIFKAFKDGQMLYNQNRVESHVIASRFVRLRIEGDMYVACWSGENRLAFCHKVTVISKPTSVDDKPANTS